MSGGSNLVVADAGFPGTVLRIVTRGVREAGDRLEVAAGEPWDPFVARCVAAGRAGVECLSGIPGSVGATPIQNVGAYGQEVSETIVSVRAYERAGGRVVEIPAAECGFTYRSSAFKREPGRWVVLAVTFALPRRPHSEPVRYAELARALGVEPGRDRAAGRRARRGARAAPRQGHGDRPGRPRLGLGRLVLHQPGAGRRRVRGARAARPRAAGRRRPRPALPAARREREDLGGLADRARRLSRAVTATPPPSRSRPSTRSRSPTAARARPSSSSPSRARSRRASTGRSGCDWSPSLCLSATPGNPRTGAEPCSVDPLETRLD